MRLALPRAILWQESHEKPKDTTLIRSRMAKPGAFEEIMR